MHRTSRSRRLVAASAAALVMLVIPAGPARADECDVEDAIFWSDQVSPGIFRSQAYGTTNSIRLANRDIDEGCPNRTLFGSTAHLILGNVYGNWVETGWKVFYQCTPYSCGKQFKWFAEWGLNFSGHVTGEGSYPCALNFGAFHRWRVSNVNGTNNWNLFVNCNSGGGFDGLDTITGTTYHTGDPTVEVFRRGGAQTGMSDDQQSLSWKNSSGSWVAWNRPACRADGAGTNNWEGVRDSSTAYHTQKGDGSC
jgi:hypothetical protein